MRLYATIADWDASEYAPAPANADRLLRTASRVVDQCLKGRVYDVDTDGMPTDPDHLEACRDACLTIAAEAAATGALEAGATREWDTVAIGSVSLSGGRDSGATTVLGISVPADAALALMSVGTMFVVVRS